VVFDTLLNMHRNGNLAVTEFDDPRNGKITVSMTMAEDGRWKISAVDCDQLTRALMERAWRLTATTDTH